MRRRQRRLLAPIFDENLKIEFRRLRSRPKYFKIRKMFYLYWKLLRRKMRLGSAARGGCSTGFRHLLRRSLSDRTEQPIRPEANRRAVEAAGTRRSCPAPTVWIRRRAAAGPSFRCWIDTIRPDSVDCRRLRVRVSVLRRRSANANSSSTDGRVLRQSKKTIRMDHRVWHPDDPSHCSAVVVVIATSNPCDVGCCR